MRAPIVLLLPLLLVAGCATSSAQYSSMDRQSGVPGAGAVDTLRLASMNEIDRSRFCHDYWQELGCRR